HPDVAMHARAQQDVATACPGLTTLLVALDSEVPVARVVRARAELAQDPAPADVVAAAGRGLQRLQSQRLVTGIPRRDLNPVQQMKRACQLDVILDRACVVDRGLAPALGGAETTRSETGVGLLELDHCAQPKIGLVRGRGERQVAPRTT